MFLILKQNEYIKSVGYKIQKTQMFISSFRMYVNKLNEVLLADMLLQRNQYLI